MHNIEHGSVVLLYDPCVIHSINYEFQILNIEFRISKFSHFVLSIWNRFVPRERWLHNIEHGSVVLLYDPCVIHSEVEKLKKLVRNCIKKYIITPTTFLSPKRVIYFPSFLFDKKQNDSRQIEWNHNGCGVFSLLINKVYASQLEMRKISCLLATFCPLFWSEFKFQSEILNSFE